MRNLLALVGLAIVLFAGVGWYCGWYTFQSTPTVTGEREFRVRVNTKEIASEVKQGAEKIEKAFGQGEQRPAAPTQEVRPAQGQPTSAPATGLIINPDGSLSFKGNFTLPPLAPKDDE
jgi:hypothetical protein